MGYSGMLSAAASLGLSLLWDTDLGLSQVDKYTYVEEEYIKVRSLFFFLFKRDAYHFWAGWRVVGYRNLALRNSNGDGRCYCPPCRLCREQKRTA